MKIHRFIGDFDLKNKEIEITGEIAKQIKLVLKLKVGEKIELCDGRHISAMAYIWQVDKKSVKVKIEKILENKENENKVILFCSVLKKENFELVVQKTTECGVSSIVPIITSRTVKTGLNMERLKKIAREASEQSGRATVPEISGPVKFEESLKLIKENDLNILFDSSGDLSLKGSFPSANIFIGPEGGWTPEEIKIAKENNFEIASLGPLALRGETAAIIATYLISHLK